MRIRSLATLPVVLALVGAGSIGTPVSAVATVAKPAKKCRVSGHHRRARGRARRHCARQAHFYSVSPPQTPPQAAGPSLTPASLLPGGTAPAAAAPAAGAPTEPVPTEPIEPTEPAPTEPVVPQGESTPPESQEATGAEPFRFFSPSSFWNTAVPAAAPLASNSSAIIGSLNTLIESEESAKVGPAINTTEYSVPIYTVPANQATVKVRLSGPYSAPTLRSAWSAVPLPPAAQPAAGRDRHLVVWQPSTDRLWEFWHLLEGSGGWQAEWGGAIQNVSSSSGAYGPESWPGATNLWGASATSLSIAGGLITLQDLQRGEINHALTMSIPYARAGVYSAPAQRSDGESSDPLSLPEGAHLRINPNLDLASLHLPHLTLMMAEAAQRYGIFIRDIAGNVTFNAQDPVSTGSNPYLGPGGYFEGSYPRKLLTPFPWHSLQLLAPG